MTPHVVATLIVLACGFGTPSLAQNPAPVPVVLPTPDPADRGPVNTAPRQPEAPVKLEGAAPSGSAPDPKTKDDQPANQPDQGHGGRGRGSSSRGPAPAQGRGPGPGPGAPHPSGGAHGWSGPAWGPPAYFARPYYWDPFWVSGAFAWSPLFYAPWPLMWGTVGYWPGPYYGPPTTFMTGAVRLKIKPREAQVIVDGYYAGIVNEFDGVFQSLRLSPGGHKIEIRLDGFEALSFDVHVQPDRTLTLTQNMKPTP